MAAFLDLLHAAQLDPAQRKVEQANPVVADEIRPHALTRNQENRLHEAWRAATCAGPQSDMRVEGFQTGLVLQEKALEALVQIAAEGKRFAAACEAFRKVLGK